MGVAIAVPLLSYRIVDTDIKNISDTKPMKPRLISPTNSFQFVSNIYSRVMMLLRSCFSFLYTDYWKLALGRSNQMVSLRLQSLSSGCQFVIGTYHMPCMFDKPAVMIMHTALSLQYIQKRAKDDPVIFCGDFNFTPNSTMYQLVMKGSLGKVRNIFTL